MALSFIGKPISLISHSDVRYRGILAGIDPAASTIQLSNVYSMGTESRRPPTEFIPPVQEPYQYIIFRASEVKDLAVDEPTPLRSVHDDPAVLGASAPAANPAYSPYPTPATAVPPVQQQQQQVPPQPVQPPLAQADAAVPTRPQPQARRSNPIHTAAASLETVERAIGDLRVSNNNNNNHTNAANNRGGRRGGRGGGTRDNVQIKVPATDFDFQSSNAKFDKAALTPRSTSAAGKENGDEEGGEAASAEEKEKEKEKETAYNPQKSFFDSLSSSSHGPPAPGAGAGGGHAGNGRGRRGGRGMGRNRREEEREKNVSTFGEPGGVGLMGPGAYVGGWGGYGRRGGRPRRGGHGGGGSAPQAVAQV